MCGEVVVCVGRLWCVWGGCGVCGEVVVCGGKLWRVWGGCGVCGEVVVWVWDVELPVVWLLQHCQQIVWLDSWLAAVWCVWVSTGNNFGLNHLLYFHRNGGVEARERSGCGGV